LKEKNCSLCEFEIEGKWPAAGENLVLVKMNGEILIWKGWIVTSALGKKNPAPSTN